MINHKKVGFETPFDHIHDVIELILAARSFMAERDQISYPLDEDTAMDAAMDFAASLIAHWILIYEQPPIDSKERLTQIIESMIDGLRRIQSLLPDDQEEHKKELLHLITRGSREFF